MRTVISNTYINCIFFNTRSLRNKITDLYALLDEQYFSVKYDVIFVCETWLDENISDENLLYNHAQYSVLRCNRPMRGGGVCAFIDKQLNFVPIALPHDFTQLEVIYVDVIRSRYKHRFIAVYRPPHYDLQCTINMMNCLEVLCDVAYGVTICGDFNKPQVNWANEYDLSCMPALKACLCCFVTDNGLQQLVRDNVRLNNTLDLLPTSEPFAIADVTVASPFSTSDHSSITWSAWFPLAQPRPEATGHDFRRIDYNGMCAYFAGIDWVQLFTCVALDDVWLLLKRIICNALDIFAPHRHVFVRTNCCPPHIMWVLKRKRYLWRRRHLAGGLSRYNLEAVRCKRLIVRYHRTKEQWLLQTKSLSTFYRHVDKKFCSGYRIAPLGQADSLLVTNDTSKAETFNAYFDTVFTQSIPDAPVAQSLDGPISNNISFTPDVVYKALKKFKRTLFAGPDAILICILGKRCCSTSTSCINSIYIILHFFKITI